MSRAEECPTRSGVQVGVNQRTIEHRFKFDHNTSADTQIGHVAVGPVSGNLFYYTKINSGMSIYAIFQKFDVDGYEDQKSYEVDLITRSGAMSPDESYWYFLAPIHNLRIYGFTPSDLSCSGYLETTAFSCSDESCKLWPSPDSRKLYVPATHKSTGTIALCQFPVDSSSFTCAYDFSAPSSTSDLKDLVASAIVTNTQLFVSGLMAGEDPNTVISLLYDFETGNQTWSMKYQFITDVEIQEFSKAIGSEDGSQIYCAFSDQQLERTHLQVLNSSTGEEVVPAKSIKNYYKVFDIFEFNSTRFYLSARSPTTTIYAININSKTMKISQQF